MRSTEPRVLFFTQSVAITPEEKDAAFEIGSNIGFRNANMANDGTEECVAVAGEAPKSYTDKYPLVKSRAQLDKLVGKSNGEPVVEQASAGSNDAELTERDKLKKEATDLGIQFANNVPTAKLQELIAEKKPDPNTPPPPPNAPTWGSNA